MEISDFGHFWNTKMGLKKSIFNILTSKLDGKNPQKVDIFHFLWKNPILAYFGPLIYPEPPPRWLLCVFSLIRCETPGNTPGQPQNTQKPPWGGSG